MKKTIFTLEVNNYAPNIVRLTRPLLEQYAEKIGADLKVITERKFPDMPPVYEKFQLYELAKENGAERNVYIDADALIHPEMPDVTAIVPRDTVANKGTELKNGCDYASTRWTLDDYFLRDGRHIGCGNWIAVVSDLCLDYWHPLEDLTPEQAYKNIHPTPFELRAGIVREHLIDDYVCSRNVARYGLKYDSLIGILKKAGFVDSEFWYHQYLMSTAEKEVDLKRVLERWNLKNI